MYSLILEKEWLIVHYVQHVSSLKQNQNVEIQQCDQIIFQYWAFYNNGKSPKRITIFQRRYIFPNTNFSLQKLPKVCSILPIWRNFAKSDHTIVVSFISDHLGKVKHVSPLTKIWFQHLFFYLFLYFLLLIVVINNLVVL